jgi:hypothetical protein
VVSRSCKQPCQTWVITPACLDLWILSYLLFSLTTYGNDDRYMSAVESNELGRIIILWIITRRK